MRWSRRKRINQRKAERRRALRRNIVIGAAVVAAITAADIFYMKLMDGQFYLHTTLNGFKVSGKTAAEVVELLKPSYNALVLNISEQGEQVLTSSFENIGFHVDEQALTEAVNHLIEHQDGFIYPGLFFGNRLNTQVPFTVDESLFASSVCADKLTKARITTTDASLEEQDGQFVIVPEVYGTDFHDSDLQQLVRDTIASKLVDATPDTVVDIAIPKELYLTPAVTKDDPNLKEKLDLFQNFINSEIVYTFGEEEVTVDWQTIRDWILPDSPENPIDEEAVYNYVWALADKYNTYGRPRTFESTNRGTMTIAYNSYGYTIDVDAEFSQLISDIYANTYVRREPIYSNVGYSRNGLDDLNGTYVEVDLSNQYLWFYKNHNLVTETPIISGLPTEERETHEGVFTIPYKASPFNLKGQGGGPGESWDVEVSYWMPFDDGQGLHDATWQSYFGGTTYQYAGSHGCINLPLGEAAAIYAEMESNVAILIYK